MWWKLSQVSGAHRTLQGHMEALLSIYNHKEAQYKQESEAAGKQLSQVAFCEVDGTRRLVQEELNAVDISLESIGGKYNQRRCQLEALRQELTSELQWMQEVMNSLHLEVSSGRT